MQPVVDGLGERAFLGLQGLGELRLLGRLGLGHLGQALGKGQHVAVRFGHVRRRALAQQKGGGGRTDGDGTGEGDDQKQDIHGVILAIGALSRRSA